MRRVFLLCFILTFFLGCGGTVNNAGSPNAALAAPPTISRLDPTKGKIGDQVTIFGFGFSPAPQQNIILFGNTATTATTYQLVTPSSATEIEKLTFTVPAGVSAGTNSVNLIIGTSTSTSTILFTVSP